MIPIQRPFPRILFAFFFSYCAAHAVLGVAFPASMGLDSPHSGTFELPWVYSFLFTLLSTSTGLKTLSEFYSKKRAKQSASIESIFKNYIFLTWCTFPLSAMVWAFVEDSMKEHALGIMVILHSIRKLLVQLKNNFLIQFFYSGLQQLSLE